MTENQPLDNAAEEMPTAQISSETSDTANAETSAEVVAETNGENMPADAATVTPSENAEEKHSAEVVSELPPAENTEAEPTETTAPVEPVAEASEPPIQGNVTLEIAQENTASENTAVEPVSETNITTENVSAEISTAAIPATVPTPPAPLTEEERAAAAAAAEVERKRKEERAEVERKRNEERAAAQKALDDVFAELTEVKNANGTIEVEVTDRIKGGLRAIYKNVRLFMPASHFSTKRVATEQDLLDAVGKKYTVNIQELQQDDQGRKTIVISRKKLAKDEFFTQLKEGEIVDGRISFVASFGVFVDLNGVEGLIHISRLSHNHVDDATKLFKKGDPIQAKIIAIDPAKEKITLSRKELEPSPWVNVESEFPEGSRHKGVVKRFADFGTYVMIKPGVEGLLRNYDLSWGRRINHPSEVLTIGQTIDVQILSVSEEKKRVALGHKQTMPNPWDTISEVLPVGTMIQAVVREVSPQGVVVRVSDEFDGFVPRGRVRNNDASMVVGNTVELMVLDAVAATASLILAPKYEDDGGYNNDRRSDRSGQENNYRNEDKPRNSDRPRNDDRRDNRNSDRRDDRPRRDDRREDRRGDRAQQQHQEEPKQDFAFFDLLSDEQKKNLGVK
ncbi:MAG: S1 RNA-binding domain-containing protein [Ignavibacteriae bacterium]|nr:S1 RNA-binding domain-containing protein [Ignavibacteriota bacterium]